MDLDLILIFGFVIVIVAIVGRTITSVASKVIEYKKSQNADTPAADRAENARLSERTDYLEERVRVLERIATDKDSELAREIESLRNETPRLEQQ